jgi:ferredoxin
MRRVRIFVIGLLMLWLPLQAVAAVSMPFCPHSGTAGVAQTSVHAHHQHEDSTPVSGHHGSQRGDQHPPAGALEQCNNCGACNLACAPAVPVSAVLLSGTAITVQPDFSAHSPALFIPDQPQPPPNLRF